MLKIFEIPKNAGNFSRFLNSSFIEPKTINVLIIRNPYERFWSATKTVVNEISIFGSFPFEDNITMRTTYDGLEFSVEEVINKSLSMLEESDYYIHLKPQAEFIGENKFDEVVYFENLNEQMQELIEKYNVKTIENFSLGRKLTISPKERDEEAMGYILNTQSVKERLNEFYNSDFTLYNDISLLKKN
jgi:hypothetical protein